MKKFINGIIKENPVFVLCLGLCPALAVTTKFENAIVMSICVTVILLFSSIITSLIRKIIPKNIQMPITILIIATFVTMLEMILNIYLKPLYDILNIYISLIVVNCIVLGRCISVYSKNKVLYSLKDAIMVSLGFTLALLLISALREILSFNTLTIMDLSSKLTGYKAVYKILPESLKLTIFKEPSGAFILLGLLMALFNRLGGKNESN